VFGLFDWYNVKEELIVYGVVECVFDDEVVVGFNELVVIGMLLFGWVCECVCVV